MKSLLLPLLLLTSCGGRYVLSPPATPEEACARAADDDPAVRTLREKIAGNPFWEFQHGNQIRQVRRDAITRCLAARGLVPAGGVERPWQE